MKSSFPHRSLASAGALLVLASLTGTAHGQGMTCATPTPISGLGTWQFDPAPATNSTLLPPCTTGAWPDYWFEWTSGPAGNYTFDGCQDGAPPIRTALYDTCGGPAIACGQNPVSMTASASTTYLLQIQVCEPCLGCNQLIISGPAPVPGDKCEDPLFLTGTGSRAYTTVGAFDEGNATTCTNSSEQPDIWIGWTAGVAGNYNLSVCADYDASMAIFDGCSGAQLACDDDGSCSSTVNDAELNFNASASAYYLIKLTSWDGSQGSGMLDVDGPPGVTNDDCTSATPISGLVSVPYSTVGATQGNINPDCGSGLNNDIWYRWTSGPAGAYTFTNCGASFDTVLDIRFGCPFSISLGCSESGACAGGFNDTQVLIPDIDANTEYYIQIAGWEGATGTGTLEIDGPPGPPDNDDCADATPITGYGTFDYDLRVATTDGPADLLCGKDGDAGIDNDVWYDWTAPASGLVRVMTCGDPSNVDTELGVYAGAGCPVGAPVDCGDQECPMNKSIVSLNVTAGQIYKIRLGSFEAGASSEGFGEFYIDPVANSVGTVGTSYCPAAPNSASPFGASISASGSVSVAANSLSNALDLRATGLPPSTPGIFYYGATQVQVPFGNGLRCVGGQSFRFSFVFASAGGVAEFSPDISVAPHASAIQPGTSWNFQYWHRDPAAGGAAFNLSNARRIHFLP